MDIILDERSLVPCSVLTPGVRVERLAKTLGAFDQVGARRVLRTVRDAPDLDIHAGRGLRSWCFDPLTQRDAGRLVASRLSKQPFIDGNSGLFANAEGDRAVEASVGNASVIGLGLAAMNDNIATILPSAAMTAGETVQVNLLVLDKEGDWNEQHDVIVFATFEEVQRARAELIERIDRLVTNGRVIIERLPELYPRLQLGDHAHEQIHALRGTEPVFGQLLRHLRALQEGAVKWAEGSTFEPVAVSSSFESKATLKHGTFGPMRDFHTPEGFEHERWSFHTKLTGGNGARLYFRPERVKGQAVILIGYFGNHLPTVSFKS